jgi:hypothetical protein
VPLSARSVSTDEVAPAPAAVEALRVVCAWCKKVLHEGAPGAATSHGICTACAPKLSGVAEVAEDGTVEFLA